MAHEDLFRSKGNLYYIRLKTDYGIFYKIGFTRLESAEARFNYSGDNDARYIDKVILFLPMFDAYDIEQELHRCLASRRAFHKYSNIPDFLLAGNGQSELYAEDVLRMDREFTEQQKLETAAKFKNQKRIIAGISEDHARRQDALQSATDNFLMPVLLAIAIPIGILISAINGLFGGRSVKQEVASHIHYVSGRKKAEEQKVLDDRFEAIRRQLRQLRVQQLQAVLGLKAG